MIPMPHQIEGAKFLSARRAALLADEPRVGKTGAAIIAADLIFAHNILVVTTASGRAVWRRAFAEWSVFRRPPITVVTGFRDAMDRFDGVTVISWSLIAKPDIRKGLMQSYFDLAILDESHYAKNFEAGRTQAAYGEIIDDGGFYSATRSVIRNTKRCWCLTGTPIANAQNDLYPMLRALAPERLTDPSLGPDVLTYREFLHRYCVIGMKRISQWHRIPVVVGSKNLDELNERLKPFMLRRLQKDVGVRESIYEILPLLMPRATERKTWDIKRQNEIIKAAEAGNTHELTMHLGPHKRLLGQLKAPLLVELVKEEFENGLKGLVIMAWHTDVIDALAEGLKDFRLAVLDGRTLPAEREEIEEAGRLGALDIVIGQIVAAGEAIDLSWSNELIFAESSTVPKDMRQASLRITNLMQKRQTRVRVAVLDGSFDDKVETTLLRKWSAIREVLKPC